MRFSFANVLLLLLGLVFFLTGLWVATVSRQQARADAERAERLAPLSAAALEDAAPGREALVEGTIDRRTPARFRDFVAYVREEYRGSDDEGDPQWSEDERVTPSLLVAAQDGVVSVQGDSYELLSPPHAWQESDQLSWNGFSDEGTKRYRGLRAGDAVTAIGVTAEGQEGMALAPELVFGGSRAAYIASRRDDAAFAPWFGAIFMAIGLILGGVGGWLARTGR
jgi:hypothetical protein